MVLQNVVMGFAYEYTYYAGLWIYYDQGYEHAGLYLLYIQLVTIHPYKYGFFAAHKIYSPLNTARKPCEVL